MGKISDSKLDSMIDKIKERNLLKCILLKYISDTGMISLELNEHVYLEGIANNVIKRTIEKRLFPKRICESDLREIFPDVEIPQSVWKEKLMNKFVKVV